ncbi:hypothetical protein IE4872_CH02250 [Rhizobium gallicum]|uniref:Uncharacterized protein n=1 Tax=Rhizobium gallicum TaxID=56730 RepID=A0A1L5NIY3_9HYPH|nr:hypothetical protein IE4872_CH02250 [Rhizobium gallicum]
MAAPWKTKPVTSSARRWPSSSVSSPNMDIVDWLVRQHSSSVFTTAVTEAEILYGLRILAEERRRQELEAAILQILREDIGGCPALRSGRIRCLCDHCHEPSQAGPTDQPIRPDRSHCHLTWGVHLQPAT